MYLILKIKGQTFNTLILGILFNISNEMVWEEWGEGREHSPELRVFPPNKAINADSTPFG